MNQYVFFHIDCYHSTFLDYQKKPHLGPDGPETGLDLVD